MRESRSNAHASPVAVVSWPAIVVIESPAIGEAWLAVATQILSAGEPERYDELPILELAYVTLVIAAPAADDALIARYGDPERLRWMRANLATHDRVAALGGARSYASRLFDYAGSGRDQARHMTARGSCITLRG